MRNAVRLPSVDTLDGILLVNKPSGLTSHDVVSRVRRLSDQKRVGHAGTLDPLAEGLLVLCLGQATRLSEYLMASPKTYRARIRLGQETDSYDAEGQLVASKPANVDRQAVQRALDGFVGPQMQLPPMFSAVKVEGRPLYKLARRGVSIERQPRPIEIYSICLEEFETPEAEIVISCSPGTYVRTLAHDLGQRLETGAFLAALVRLASGSFRLDAAHDLVQLGELARAGRMKEALISLDADCLKLFPVLPLDASRVLDLLHGRAIAIRPDEPATEVVQGHAPDGKLVALLEADRGAGVWRPRKVLGRADGIPDESVAAQESIQDDKEN